MKIIDAQVHIWSQTVVPTSGLHRKVEKFTAEQVLSEMDEAGVDAALIHPPLGWDPNSNAVAIEAVKKHPGRFAIMGNFPLQNPDNRKLIHGWRNQPGMMGLRWPLLLEEHQKWLHDGSLDWLWPAVEQEGLPIARKAQALSPREPTILDTVGWIEYLNGNTAEAARLLVQAARGAPGNAEIRLHNAIALASQGARAAAESELAEALKLNPALEKRTDVQELRSKLQSGQN